MPTRRRFAVVTGGGKGIGEMITRHLLDSQTDLHVIVVSRSTSDQSWLNHSRIHTIQADLITQTPLVGEKIEQIVGDCGLEVLIHNSGATWGESIESYSMKGFDKVMSLNVRSVFELTQKCLKSLRLAAKINQYPSRIISIGSINAINPPALETYAYSASKAALHHLTKHLARHLAPEITVNCIACGLFHTKMTNATIKMMEDPSKLIPMKRIGNQKDIGSVVDLFIGKGGEWLTGSILVLDGGSSLMAYF